MELKVLNQVSNGPQTPAADPAQDELVSNGPLSEFTDATPRAAPEAEAARVHRWPEQLCFRFSVTRRNRVPRPTSTHPAITLQHGHRKLSACGYGS